MSHFVTVVILPKKPVDVQEEVGILMAPFDENKEMDAYNEDCDCIGMLARGESIKQAEKQLGITWDEILKRFDALKRPPQWGTYTKELRELGEKLEKVHPLYNKPDVTCEECKGTGKHETTYNPNSKWDFWTIGGRWTGFYSGYDPEKDPANLEQCRQCKGLGKHNRKTCDYCKGTGKSAKWPTQWVQHSGDILSVKAVLVQIQKSKGKKTPFAIVTPEGEWIQKGKMGWWACVKGEKKIDAWKKEVIKVFEKYSNGYAVVVDCHI